MYFICTEYVPLKYYTVISLLIPTKFFLCKSSNIVERASKQTLEHQLVKRSFTRQERVSKSYGWFSCEKEEDGIGSASRSLSLAHSFSSDVTPFLSSWFEHFSLFDMRKEIPQSRWSAKVARQVSYNWLRLVFRGWLCRYSVAYRTLEVKHLLAGSGVFVTKSYDQGFIVVCYYELLVQECLYQHQHITTIYSEPSWLWCEKHLRSSRNI